MFGRCDLSTGWRKGDALRMELGQSSAGPPCLLSDKEPAPPVSRSSASVASCGLCPKRCSLQS